VLFEIVIGYERSVFYAVFIGINGVNRIAQQFCYPVVIMNTHADKGEDPVLRAEQLPFKDVDFLPFVKQGIKLFNKVGE